MLGGGGGGWGDGGGYSQQTNEVRTPIAKRIGFTDN